MEGVETTADSALNTTEQLEAMATEHRGTIQSIGRAAGSALRVHEAFTAYPLLDAAGCATRTGLSSPTVNNALKLLTDLGIVAEVTGRRRDRIYAYTDYLTLLNEHTESP